MNEQLIDTIVDPAASKQVSDLTKLLNSLDIELVTNTKDATKLNAALLANSKTFVSLNKLANESALANEKLLQSQNKTAITAANLTKAEQQREAQIIRTTAAQERAAASQVKILSPYQQMSKELDKQRASAKDLLVLYGEFDPQTQKAVKGVQSLDAKIKQIDQTLGQSQRNVGNYGNAFKGLLTQYIPFGDSTIKVSENLKTLTGDIGESEESLGGLTAGFAEFTTGGFIVAIAAATYYLSQFKSTGEIVEANLAGIKSGFAQFGGNFFGLSGDDAATPFEAFQAGKKSKQSEQELENAQSVKDIQNASLEAEGQYFRALSEDRTKDIVDRQSYLAKAEAIEKKILDNQKNTAQETINTALKVGFTLTTLNQQQQDSIKKRLSNIGDGKGQIPVSDAAQQIQDLALDGKKFTSDGLALYQTGLKQIVQYQANAQNEIVRISADKNNQELRSDLALAKAQEALDKARVQSALDASKAILDNNKSTNNQKIAANNDFVTQSIKLIKIQEQNELEAAGLGSTRGGKDTRAQSLNRQAIALNAQNQITQIQLQGTKTRQDLQKQASQAQLRLNAAQIADVQDRDKLIIDSETEYYQKRIDANQDFISKSLRLIDEQTSDKLSSAGLTTKPKNKKSVEYKEYNAIVQEGENEKNRILANGAKQTEEIQKQQSESISKSLETILNKYENLGDKASQQLTEDNDKAIQSIQQERDANIKQAEDLYIKGKISEQQYRDDLLLIDDDYNNKRLTKQLATDRAILATRQAEYNNSLLAVEGNEDSVPDVVKSNLKTAKKNVQTDIVDLGNTNAKGGKDQTQTATDRVTEQKNTAIAGVQELEKAQDIASQAIQNQYNHEIDLLEQRKQLIEDTAKADVDRVNSSILSEKDKQNQINIINAQSQAAQAQIDKKEAEIKTKAAEAEKAQAIASIIENTAIAILTLPAKGGLLGIAAIPIIAALGAAQLATVIAQPIPKFAKGGVTPGGSVLWGEAGTEVAIEPGGRSYLSSGPTIANMPKGTRIISNAELMSLNKPKSVNYIPDRSDIGWQEVVKALNRQKQTETKRPYVRVNVYTDRSGLRR